jgi:hypothetical protein
MPTEMWASFGEVRVLGRAEEFSGTSVRRIASAEGISVSLVWRILHEQSLKPYHIQQLQALTPADSRARVAFCQSLLTKCVLNTVCS